MNYKLLWVPAMSLLAAACDFKGNVYPMTPQQAYDKLVAAPIERSGKGPFGTMDISASGDGNGTVRWGNGYVTLCEANITPEGADRSRIMAYCGAGGEGAAAGISQGLERKALIEHIDAALRGRPLRPQARLWHDGGPVAGRSEAGRRQLWSGGRRSAENGPRHAQGDSDMDNMAAEDEARREARRANGDVNFKPGQPMIDPSK